MEKVIKKGRRENDWVTSDMQSSRRSEVVECFENTDEEKMAEPTNSEFLCSLIIANGGFIRWPFFQFLFSASPLKFKDRRRQKPQNAAEGFRRGFTSGRAELDVALCIRVPGPEPWPTPKSIRV